MEDRLDEISRGEYESLPYLREFYLGNGNLGLRPLLDPLDYDRIRWWGNWESVLQEQGLLQTD